MVPKTVIFLSSEPLEETALFSFLPQILGKIKKKKGSEKKRDF